MQVLFGQPLASNSSRPETVDFLERIIVNYISEHYNMVMTVLIIGDVIVVSIAIWIKVEQRSGRFYRQHRKGSHHAAKHLGRSDDVAHRRRSSATSNDKAQGITQEPAFQKEGGIVFPDVG